jgi:6-phospho-beta-glucosidase
MKNETKMREGRAGISLGSLPEFSGGGYAGVALDVMEGLCGTVPKVMTLNVQNHGAVEGMDEMDVVEVPVVVSNSGFRPLAVGSVPAHCLGLMKQVKEYERLTIAAALEGSYARAVQALTLHPLVGDYHLAVKVLEGYQQRHGDLFPALG